MKEEFNGQGKYLWSLILSAGWDKPQAAGQPLSRWEAYMGKVFKATHINALTNDQMRRAIITMKSYAAKAQFEQCKPLRQSIVAMVSVKGLDLTWLHENMQAWKFGTSLRELSYNELLSVRGLVMQALGISTTKAPRRK